MNAYRLRYIAGPQESLRVAHEHTVLADSLAAALGACCDWPVQCNRAGTCAWAKHPGTSLYEVKAWEAERLDTKR